MGKQFRPLRQVWRALTDRNYLQTKFQRGTSCFDEKGVSYAERLKQIRLSRNLSVEEVADAMRMLPWDYEEWEIFPDELTLATSLGEISQLASVLGVRSRQIFSDLEANNETLALEQFAAKIHDHLARTGISVAEFSDRVGFQMEESSKDISKVSDWNIDWLRFVCEEIGTNWLEALPYL